MSEAEAYTDAELIRLTRYETIDRYGISAMHRRQAVIRQALTADLLKDLMRRALQGGAAERGRLKWARALAFVPLAEHGLDEWDLRRAACENAGVPWSFESSVWWWRLWTLYEIADPVGWLIEQSERKEKGWARRVMEMALGRQAAPPEVYRLVKKCRMAARARGEGDEFGISQA